MVLTISFSVEGEAVGKGRPRFMKTGHTYTPQKTKVYEEHVKIRFIEAAHGRSFGGRPVTATIIAGYAVPKNVSKARREMMLLGHYLPTKKPDADNVAKAVLDALNGIAYDDDSQVIRLEVTKIYMEKPEVKVYLKDIMLTSVEDV